MRRHLQIDTARLVLVACPRAVADALVSDRTEAERLVGARLPNDWPDSELLEFLPLYSRYLREHPNALGYGAWLLVERETATVVGSAGFRGLPNDEDEIEIGYGIHPDHRCRGYATEAARALLAWGLAQPGVGQITAHCDPTNTPSLRVVAKAGMREAGERDGLARWVMT